MIAAEQERNAYVPFEIVEVTPESETITSFHLRRADGKAPANYEPGQFLPIRVPIPEPGDGRQANLHPFRCPEWRDLPSVDQTRRRRRAGLDISS